MRHFVKVKFEIKIIGRGDNQREIVSLYPTFLSTAKDLMRKGGKFYAVLDSKTGMWSTNENDMYRIIDEDLYSYADEHYCKDSNGFYHDNKNREIHLKTIEDSTTRQLIEFNKWFNNLPANFNYIPLDSSLTFLSDEVSADMYRSKRLTYDLADGIIDAYDQIMSVLYSPENREKIEWSIGSVLSGDSKKIEKMVVLYGKRGTGKSTILDLIEEIFKGYWAPFVAEELALKSYQFATAAFKDNPLIAIQDDGSLAKIDSPRINEIVSHRVTQINEKNTKQYALRPQAMLFMATNDLIDIHDTNLGITRRLLDVYPTYNLLPVREYRRLVNQMMKFEIPAIAKHCLDIYTELGKEYYSKYEPVQMIKKTNYLQNFMFEKCDDFIENDPITRSTLYKAFRQYCDDMGLPYPAKGNVFGEQVKDYYERYDDVKWINGKTQKYVYSGFKADMFSIQYEVLDKKKEEDGGWLKFNNDISVFDEWCKDKGFPAQYDTGKEPPIVAWSKVKTTMEDIDSKKLHWINIPVGENHIRVDFDFKDKDGNKDLKKNMEAANEFPQTYAEISQSGGGVHLHYFYDGDVLELNPKYSKDIEIKTDKGESGCRRKLTKCNDIPIATLCRGSLPLKGKKNMVDFENVKDERHLRSLIFKNLRKEIHPGTKPSVDFIYKILEDAYKSGMKYDVQDLQPDILAFANNSTNHGQYCVNLVHKMHFCSDETEEWHVNVSPLNGEKETPIIFFDVEVFPNLFLVNWKYQGKNNPVVRMINPSPNDIARLCKYRLIGFNNRRYDNHMLYARMMGYSTQGLYDLSQRIIGGDKNAFFREAYNLSYTDIYDFSNTKQSLKKWEIELGIHHQELGLPWDQPVPEDMWEKVAEYCDNDVIATEAVFEHLHEDWMARKILALLSGLSVNDTTNSHTTRIIVGDDKNPQNSYIYTDLSTEFPGYEFNPDGIPKEKYKEGTKIVAGKSLYLGEDPGEGGYVYAEPGMYYMLALLDIASMHPNSARNLNIFGKYQPRYNALIDSRLAIKHKNYDEALKQLLFINPDVEDELKGYLSDAGDTKALSYALKIPINSVYGLTSAKFENKLKDPRNIDNIVAKRGALFMINLKHEVQKRGFKLIADQNVFKPFTVAHVKTDSIKIPNATPEIIEFVSEYGKKYGYSFEHEATYKKMCLVNDAVYVAQYADGEHEFKLPTGEKVMTSWTATGAEFQHPYVFKKLFANKELVFKDFCETKSVQKGELYLDMDEELPEGEHNMVFVGRVGSFVPIKPGCGGGRLYRVQDGKNYAAAGTKGYRWLEAEMVKALHKENDIDMSYYEKLCSDAIDHISEFGDFDRFLNDESYDANLEKYLNAPEELPWDTEPVDDFMNKPIAS